VEIQNQSQNFSTTAKTFIGNEMIDGKMVGSFKISLYFCWCHYFMMCICLLVSFLLFSFYLLYYIIKMSLFISSLLGEFGWWTEVVWRFIW